MSWANFAVTMSEPFPLGGFSGRDLLVGEMRRIRALRRMLDGDGAQVAAGIHIHECVFAQIARLDDGFIRELDEQGIRVLEVANFHGLNLRSMKALWTGSPPATRIARRYQRRMLTCL